MTKKKTKQPKYRYKSVKRCSAYTLGIAARDENGFKDAPADGRNVLKLTVR